MTETETERVPDLVDEFLKPAPSLPFVLKRKQADGSVKEIPYRCRLLRLDQMTDVLRAAQAFAKESQELKDYGDIYREAQAHETIQRVMCRAEVGDNGKLKPMFVDANHVRRSLDEIECAQILTTHQITREHFRMTGKVDAAQLEEMVHALADEMAGPYFLSQWDSADWPTFIFELARMVESLWKKTGYVPSSLDSSSESPLENSDPGTTGSPAELSLQLSGDEEAEIPTSVKPMTREEAKAFVLSQQQLTKPDADDD